MTGRTVEQVAAAIGARPELVRQLLEEDVQRGIVEHDAAGQWRLAAAASRRFGRALQELSKPEGGTR